MARRPSGARKVTWGRAWTKHFLQSNGLLANAPRNGVNRRERWRRPLLPGMMLHRDGSPPAWLKGRQQLDLIVTLDDVGPWRDLTPLALVARASVHHCYRIEGESDVLAIADNAKVRLPRARPEWLNSDMSWIVSTLRPRAAGAVCSAAIASIASLVTLRLFGKRPYRTAPARLPPRRRRQISPLPTKAAEKSAAPFAAARRRSAESRSTRTSQSRPDSRLRGSESEMAQNRERKDVCMRHGATSAPTKPPLPRPPPPRSPDTPATGSRPSAPPSRPSRPRRRSQAAP